MKEFMTLVRNLPFAMKVLLLSTAARALSFFALLAYMPIYLYDTVGMSGATVGYVIGGSVLIGTLASVYGGYLADRVTKIDLMIGLDIAIVMCYLSLTVIHDPFVVTAVLVIANVASATMGVAGSSLIAELVPGDERTKVFSLRYSLQNLGAVVGPFLGVAAVVAGSSGPLIFGAGVITAALVPLMLFRRRFITTQSETSAATPADGDEEKSTPRFREVLKVMQTDRRLTFFTLGGILSILAYGPLLTIMSQYLVLVESSEKAYRLVAYISAANAVVVVSTQYILGSRLKQHNLLRWLTMGTVAFVIGLLMMSWSTNAVVIVIAVMVFSLGEVIVVPAEFTFIDSIAPANLRGSYFGAQNLVHIGIALGPIVCGFLLQHFTPAVMFIVLIAIVITGWWFFVIGCRSAVSATKHSPRVTV